MVWRRGIHCFFVVFFGFKRGLAGFKCLKIRTNYHLANLRNVCPDLNIDPRTVRIELIEA